MWKHERRSWRLFSKNEEGQDLLSIPVCLSIASGQLSQENHKVQGLCPRERERKWIKQLSCKLVPFFTPHFLHSFCLRVAPTPYHKVSTLLKRLLIHSYLRDGVKCVKGNVIFCNKKNNLTWSHPTTRWIHLNVHLRTLKLFLSISQHY